MVGDIPFPSQVSAGSGSTVPTQVFPNTPVPCPNCGKCPTCGKNKGYPFYGGWWTVQQPYYTINCSN